MLRTPPSPIRWPTLGPDPEPAGNRPGPSLDGGLGTPGALPVGAVTRPTALIAYASSYGHTEKVARRIQAVLQQDGTNVQLTDVEVPATVELVAFDLVLVGATVHAGRHQRSVADWLREHRQELSSVPTALFSISLTAADPRPHAVATTHGYLRNLCQNTGLDPTLTVALAGTVRYREYGVATRRLMGTIADANGLEADSSRDLDYTDWPAVTAFAHAAGHLTDPAPPVPAPAAALSAA